MKYENELKFLKNLFFSLVRLHLNTNSSLSIGVSYYSSFFDYFEAAYFHKREKRMHFEIQLEITSCVVWSRSSRFASLLFQQRESDRKK